jgi:N-acyl-D-amino-acid deacylase
MKANRQTLTSGNVTKATEYDLIILGGTLYDGTGVDGIRADVAISGDRIVAVGDLSLAPSARTINATGKIVAPGFIDIHTHSDISVSYDTGQASHLAMGVTTQVVGNCGLSMGFATPARQFEIEQRWVAPHGARITWNTFAEHLDQIEAGGIATNFVPLAGHGTLRKRVMGIEERAHTTDELHQMQRELAGALAAGAWGLSSGLEYPPSAYADVAELTRLCEVVRDYGGFYATHLRNEGDTLIEAVQEALDVAEGAGVPLQLSHHKAEGQANWGKVQTTLEMVTAARQRGIDVQLDQYPYTAFMTGLAIQVLPRFALAGSHQDMIDRLADPARRAEIMDTIRATHPEWDDLSELSPWKNMQIGVCRGRPEIQGRKIADLVREAGANPIETVLDLLMQTPGYISAVNFAIGETDIAAVMRYPWTAIGSDGIATHPTGTAKNDQIHPRAYGTFARVLGRYVRELGVLTTAEAIHKMTGLPATRLGLPDRGLLEPGYYADVVVYDPDVIADRATFAAPHQFACGIECVVVNGVVALDSGGPTEARAGTLLRRT